MDISLGGLRSTALSMRSWNSSGTNFNNRCRDAARTAAAEISAEVPNALLPDDEHVVLYPDQLSTDTAVNAHVRATTDQWVLEFTDTSARVLGHPSSATTWRPTTTGEWDGVMHLEVQDPAGVWHRRQSRTWWTAIDIAQNNTWYVTLDRRWRNTTDSAMAFRIHQPAFWLRAEDHDLLAPSMIWDETRQRQWPIEAGTAHRQDLQDFRGESLSRPYQLFRGRAFQMPAPYFTPTVTPGGAGTWVGPWQEGTFAFLWTLCWGYRDAEWQELPGGMREPVWESAPSPVSVAFDHSVAANNGRSAIIALPNIDAELNFGISGTLRIGRSGFFARVYVAQTAIRTAGAGSSDYNRVETPNIYYPIADADFLGTAISYTWTGAQIPDRLRQLRRNARYFAWTPYPHQDARYELDLRVLRQTPEFVDDQDTLPLHETFHPAFLHLFLSYLCLMDGADLVSSEFHHKRYRDLIETVRDVDESPAEVVEPVPWGGDTLPDNYGVYTEET